jgi:hypothetical protein
MKHVAKIAFFIVLISITLKGMSQCTPASSLPTWGIFPSVLDPATIHVAYSQVIQFKTSVDTVVSGVDAKIDSIFIINVTGLPASFTYQCNRPDCKANGGEIGCVLLSGTPGAAGHYPIKVAIQTYARVNIFGSWVNQTQTDTNYAYYIDVNYATGLFDVQQSSNIAIFPNPAHTKMEVLLLNKLAGNEATCSVIDRSGKEIFRQQHISSKLDVDVQQFPAGIYIVVISDGASVMHKKFSVE